jgi:hypothetical protein
MSAIIPNSPKTKMPQIDFREAFASTEQDHEKTAESILVDHIAVPARPVTEKLSWSARLSRSGWANIIFVTVTVIGGLLCTFYLFNGAELLRAAAGWPREFLYSRPFAFARNAPNKAPEVRAQLPPVPGAEPSSDHGPFGPKAGRLALDSPPFSGLRSGANPSGTGSPSVPSPSFPPPFSNPGSLLGQLNILPPGGDALLQSFNKTVADLQHAASQDARRTVVVVKTAVAQIRQRANATARNALKSRHTAPNNTVTNVDGQRSQATTATQNQTLALSRQANNVSQPLGGIRGGISSTGAGLSGLGGIGGIGGLGSGGLGGGGLGGLGGGHLGGGLGGGRR